MYVFIALGKEIEAPVALQCAIPVALAKIVAST